MILEALSFDLWELTKNGPADKLNQTVNTQPAMLVAGIAAYRALQEELSFTPNYFAGHSLGEYTALVASGQIGVDLNLNNLAMSLENTEYEPEQFPGLVFKLGGKEGAKKATFLLFSNGKIVCTGTKSEKEVNEAVDMLIEILMPLNPLK